MVATLATINLVRFSSYAFGIGDRPLPAEVELAAELRGGGFNWATLAQLNRPTLWSFAIVSL
jgi:hypothetical protein